MLLCLQCVYRASPCYHLVDPFPPAPTTAMTSLSTSVPSPEMTLCSHLAVNRPSMELVAVLEAFVLAATSRGTK